MSSAAAAGPHANRHDPVSGGGPAGGSRGANGVRVGFGDGTRGADRIFPHIDDLVAAKPDVNVLAPIRRLLIDGETYAKQADTHLDFRRPELALQEYIKASIITVDIIPRHKDYPELISDRGDLHRLYAGLKKRINSQHQKFEDVKDIIKENNARSEVKPTLHSEILTDSVPNGQHPKTSRSQPLPVHAPIIMKESTSLLRGAQDNETSRSNKHIASPALPPGIGEVLPTRQKPPVQPKPDALHGRIIKEQIPQISSSASTKEDLAVRFARLRGAGPHSPVQDPRIRTRPIGMPDVAGFTAKPSSPQAPLSTAKNNAQIRVDRPLGTRDIPQAPEVPPRPQKIPLDVQIPSMPKHPDAIYSPAWNSDDPVNSDMLRSTPRGPYGVAGRSGSVAPSSGAIRTSTSINERNDYFAPPQGLSNGIAPKKLTHPKLPDATTISAEELMEYVKRGSHELYMLLVDIRNREDFDSGHIMSHSIICIEPIILRKGISADELKQSLVLSPEAEQSLFDTRESFDVVVYYDQSSTSNESSASTSHSEIPLEHFSKAVYDYGYDKRLKRQPMLLVGGLDAWIDLVGPGALEASKTSASTSTRNSKSAGQLSAKAPMARETRRLLATRRAVYESRPLSKEEEAKWEEALREEEASLKPSDGISYVRTTEDFFRRFPEPSAIQESMVSPPNFPDSEKSHVRPQNVTRASFDTSYQGELLAMPQIPARPAPALPRQSYSGVSERSNAFKTTSGPVASLEFRLADTISPPAPNQGRTGISNPGFVVCYMNSVIQALNWTIFLSTYLTTDRFLREGKPPRKKGETSDPPQLMAKAFANLLRHLCLGHVAYLKDAHTLPFRKYVHEVHSAQPNIGPKKAFGGNQQQDAGEFLDFLLNVLDDELNPARDKLPLMTLTPSQEEVRRQQPLIRSSWIEWQRYLHTKRSIITRNFGGQSVNTKTCNHCQFVSHSWDEWLYVLLAIPDKGTDDLQSALVRRFRESEIIEDYRCSNCKRLVEVQKRETLSRCPEILIIMLNRTRFNAVENKYWKVTTKVTFPLEGLDMSAYFISLNEAGSEPPDSDCQPPFRYQCYAVIQHMGDSIDKGHYWTLARNPKSRRSLFWTEFDDINVRDVPAEKTQSKDSYILFYRRYRSEAERI